MNFHENYLGRKINEYLNLGFREFLIEVRIQEAEKLLCKSELSVKEIVEEIGYQSPSFFYKAFNDYAGMTPLDYRKYHKEA